MFKVDVVSKSAHPLEQVGFKDLGLKERYDVQEWIAGHIELLGFGDEFLVIAKELTLPSNLRLDLLAVDRNGFLVIIELKRGNSDDGIHLQAIKYASYCADFTDEEIISCFARYKEINNEEAQAQLIEHIKSEDDVDNGLTDEYIIAERLNAGQRIVLVASEFHKDVVNSVFWLIEQGLDISCVSLQPLKDDNGSLFVNGSIVIPEPNIKEHLFKERAKATKKIQAKRSTQFDLTIGQYPVDELKSKLKFSLNRKSKLTPRLVAFFELLLQGHNSIRHDEIKQAFCEQYKFTDDIGQAGRFLSNISQYLTNKRNDHLRQLVKFDSEQRSGAHKDNFVLDNAYRALVQEVLNDIEKPYPPYGREI